jgi:hypothetical protein
MATATDEPPSGHPLGTIDVARMGLRKVNLEVFFNGRLVATVVALPQRILPSLGQVHL